MDKDEVDRLCAVVVDLNRMNTCDMSPELLEKENEATNTLLYAGEYEALKGAWNEAALLRGARGRANDPRRD